MRHFSLLSTGSLLKYNGKSKYKIQRDISTQRYIQTMLSYSTVLKIKHIKVSNNLDLTLVTLVLTAFMDEERILQMIQPLAINSHLLMLMEIDTCSLLRQPQENKKKLKKKKNKSLDQAKASIPFMGQVDHINNISSIDGDRQNRFI